MQSLFYFTVPCCMIHGSQGLIGNLQDYYTDETHALQRYMLQHNLVINHHLWCVVEKGT